MEEPFPKLSPLCAPLGIQRVNYKNLSSAQACRGAGMGREEEGVCVGGSGGNSQTEGDDGM